MIAPDREVLELIHEVVLGMSGGKAGIHDEKMLQSAVHRPETYIQFADSYDLDTICAVSMDAIARYHGYKDGNKRTALMTTIFTYRVNGVHFKATQTMNRDFDETVMWIVNKTPPMEEIIQRLKELRAKHSVEKKEDWGSLLGAFRKFKNSVRK